MKKIVTLLALGSVGLLSADQYDQNRYDQNRSNYCPSCNDWGSNYQDQSNDNYNQRGQEYQNQRSNSQRNDQNYRRQNNRPYGNDQQMDNDNNYGSQRGDQKLNSDQEIRRSIHEALSSGWFSKGFQEVSFDVKNGNVTLKGSVDTIENKNKIESNIKKIDGVKQVNNQITVSKETADNYSDSQLLTSEKKYPQDAAASADDRQLNAKIRDKLGSGWFSKGYETLVLRTTNGVVVISGTVDKTDDIQKINDQVKNVDGVKSVNNQLMMKNR